MNAFVEASRPVRWPSKLRPGSLVRQFIPIEPEFLAARRTSLGSRSWRDPPRGTSDFRPSRWTVTSTRPSPRLCSCSSNRQPCSASHFRKVALCIHRPCLTGQQLRELRKQRPPGVGEIMRNGLRYNIDLHQVERQGMNVCLGSEANSLRRTLRRPLHPQKRTCSESAAMSANANSGRQL